MTTTITTVRVVSDLLTIQGYQYEALLPLTITIESGMITIGSHNGPDLWRAKLEDLT